MPVMFEGTWYNQYPSEMVLKVDPASGAVVGTYQTGVGAPKPGEKFALTGFVSGDLIAFAVNFGVYGSLTSWVGQLTEDEQGSERIETLWHLSKNVPDPDEKTKLWGSVLTGADIFRRTPPAEATLKAARRSIPSHPVKSPK